MRYELLNEHTQRARPLAQSDEQLDPRTQTPSRSFRSSGSTFIDLAPERLICAPTAVVRRVPVIEYVRASTMGRCHAK
jgi:hypothetical protein